MHAADGGKDIAGRAAELCGVALMQFFKQIPNRILFRDRANHPCGHARGSDDEITLFDALGLAVEDVMCGKYLVVGA